MLTKIAEVPAGIYFQEFENCLFFIRNNHLCKFTFVQKTTEILYKGVYNFFCFEHFILAGVTGNEKSVLIDLKSGENQQLNFDLNIPGIKTATGYYGSMIYEGKPSILFFSFFSKKLEQVYSTQYGISNVISNGRYLSVFSQTLYCFHLNEADNSLWQHNLLQYDTTNNSTFFPVAHRPQLVNNTVCIGISYDNKNFICGIDFDTGLLKWKKNSSSHFFVYDTKVFSFASLEDKMVLLITNADTGSCITLDISAALEAKPYNHSFGYTVREHRLYYSFYSLGYIGVIDLRTGMAVWKHKIELTKENWQIGDPVLTAERLYILGQDSSLFIFENI